MSHPLLRSSDNIIRQDVKTLERKVNAILTLENPSKLLVYAVIHRKVTFEYSKIETGTQF